MHRERKKRLQNEIHLKMKYITKRKKNDLEKIALKNEVFLFNRRSCVDFILQCVLFCPVLVLFAFYKPLQLTMLNSFFIAFVCSSLHIICCISGLGMDAAKKEFAQGLYAMKLQESGDNIDYHKR